MQGYDLVIFQCDLWIFDYEEIIIEEMVNWWEDY